jgi:lipoprotein-anchoring transpeptidase ErfK/SrfK
MHQGRSYRIAQILLAGAIVGVMLLTSACGGDSHLQQQASQARTQLDQQIKHAQSIGVPASALQPITQQEGTLNNSSAPFSMFDDSPINSYYRNQTSSYQQLSSKLQQEVAIVTGQDQGQAQQDLANFKQALTTQQAQKAGDLQDFSLRYTTDENKLAAAQYPKDYLAISSDSQNATIALNQMGSTYSQLGIFKNTIGQMQQARLDVTAMQSQYNSDIAVFNTATTTDAFNNLGNLLNAQYQLAVVSSIQSLPYVGAAKLQEFQNQINNLKAYGMDASKFVTLYNTDQANMTNAKTIADYLSVSSKIDNDMASMHDELVQGESWYLIKQLDQEANAWGQANLYHDKFDGKDYILDSGYTMAGIGYWLQRENGWSYTTADYQSVVNDDQNEMFNFQMMQQDYTDKTPYNQVHQTDLAMMQHYPSLQHGTVIMVNLVEQSLRFYVDGKLANAFLVTTGRVELPSLPGVWSVQGRNSPTVFKSDDPPSSPYWYPPTNINYAISYHWGGYFVHDAWWRDNFGPGTQFPHYDASGDESFSGNGSHGCVNVQEQQAAWLYAHTDFSTQIAIY